MKRYIVTICWSGPGAIAWTEYHYGTSKEEVESRIVVDLDRDYPEEAPHYAVAEKDRQ